MAPLPEIVPDTDRRWVLRVAPDPYVRFDTNDYSLDPDLVGQRVEIRVGDREITAVALDSGQLACCHTRSFAKHRTITALSTPGRWSTPGRSSAAATAIAPRSSRPLRPVRWPSMTS
jgi:hypothetical protein